MATGRIRPIRAALFAEFPSLRDWGSQNCRKISGSVSWSQHAWENANDAAHPAGEPSRGSPTLAAAAAWLRGHRDRGTLFDGVRVGTVLFQNGSDTTQGHWDHIHYEAYPKQTGTPPCAGGGGGGGELDMEAIKGIQRSLNAAGFRDAAGKTLVVDGVWGTRTEFAFTSMCAAAKSGGGGAHTHSFTGTTGSGG